MKRSLGMWLYFMNSDAKYVKVDKSILFKRASAERNQVLDSPARCSLFIACPL